MKGTVDHRGLPDERSEDTHAIIGHAKSYRPVGPVDKRRVRRRFPFLALGLRHPGSDNRASVTIKFVAGRSKTKLGAKIRTEWDLKTSQEGVAKIPSIPQGKILIQVHVPNYQTFGQTFDVEQEEQTIEVKLNPPQAQYTAHP